jgi:lipopolysaccharide/colanic/teichoic acid biosynthesis glycosyltransferase
MTTIRRIPTIVYQENRTFRRLRRAFDITVASCVLVATTPILAIACAAIVLEDRGPVLFRQRRAGRFERTFTIYKLRTMRLDSCDDRPSPTAGTDRRITRVGRFLRKTSIDELPQLINVLRGDMSLIGPRPEMPMMVGNYESWQHLRHLVSPGITCIWQTTCRSTVPLHRPQATALDLDYIDRASPLLDLSLLIRTVLSIVLPKGAY